MDRGKEAEGGARDNRGMRTERHGVQREQQEAYPR